MFIYVSKVLKLFLRKYMYLHVFLNIRIYLDSKVVDGGGEGVEGG